MKKLISLFIFLFFVGINFNTYAQLTGTKIIPGDYPTVSAAITALNSNGVGSGGVTFNVNPGHSEIASNLVIAFSINPPTTANPVVFTKNGTIGANPLITAAPGGSTTADGIIKLSGADFITFNGFELVDPVSNTGNAMMEWGFALLRASASDGCQNVVISNNYVTLQKINTSSVGIYIANRDIAGTTVNATGPAGQNSFNQVSGNLITDIYKGITVLSSSTARDVDNVIGFSNQIYNWGGSNVSAEGIRCEGQINVKISGNIINGGEGTTNAVVGIIATLFGATGSAPNYEINFNAVTVASSPSSSMTHGIRALATGDTVHIQSNRVENCNANSNTSAFTAITHDPTGTTNAAFIDNNVVRFNTHSGTGTTTLLAGAGGGAITSLVLHSNAVFGNQKTGASGTMNCIQAADASVECYNNIIYNNLITNTSAATSSFLYGYINSGTPVIQRVYDNVFFDLSMDGSNSSATIVAGIRSSAGTSSTTHIYRNKIHNITNNTPSGSASGCYVSSGTTVRLYNNFISEIKAPNSTNVNGVVGINIPSLTTNSTVAVYFNSIYLTASGSSTFGSSGVSVIASATATTAALDLRNNIIINLSTPGSTSGVTTAYRRSSVNLANYSSTSNYNNFYAGASSTNRLIFFDGTNSDQTLATYQTRVAPRDANSKSVSVAFADPVVGNLHLAGGSIGDLNLIGRPVSGITTDIDNFKRSITYPYIGADESTPFNALYLTVNLEACSPHTDTITVIVRNATSPFAVVDSSRIVLDASGNASLSFENVVNGVNYYLVVRHRNSIETWSKAGGEVFTGGTLTYDFTTAASQAFGNNMVNVGGEWSIFTGDVNQDGIVDGGDLSLIDNDAFNFVTGYVPTDLNCDSIVDGTDAAYADNNAFDFVQVQRP